MRGRGPKHIDLQRAPLTNTDTHTRTAAPPHLQHHARPSLCECQHPRCTVHMEHVARDEGHGG